MSFFQIRVVIKEDCQMLRERKPKGRKRGIGKLGIVVWEWVERSHIRRFNPPKLWDPFNWVRQSSQFRVLFNHLNYQISLSGLLICCCLTGFNFTLLRGQTIITVTFLNSHSLIKTDSFCMYISNPLLHCNILIFTIKFLMTIISGVAIQHPQCVNLLISTKIVKIIPLISYYSYLSWV